MSGNHNQSLERALAIVEAAAASGAHASKLQTYSAGTMTLPVSTGGFFIYHPHSLWHGKSLYEPYKIAHTPWEWYPPLIARAAGGVDKAFSIEPAELAALVTETDRAWQA